MKVIGSFCWYVKVPENCINRKQTESERHVCPIYPEHISRQECIHHHHHVQEGLGLIPVPCARVHTFSKNLEAASKFWVLEG